MAACLALGLPQLAWAGLPSQVAPIDTRADGVYGRLDGDVALSGEVLVEASRGGPAPGVRVAAHYYWMAGAYAGFSRLLESGGSDRVLSVGLDLRPAFLPRWSLGLQTGPSWLDLTVDSIAVCAGAYWAQPEDSEFGRERGLELGLGVGFPLMAEAEGAWLSLRGLRRFADDRRDTWVLHAGLSWQLPWQSPLVE